MSRVPMTTWKELPLSGKEEFDRFVTELNEGGYDLLTTLEYIKDTFGLPRNPDHKIPEGPYRALGALLAMEFNYSPPVLAPLLGLESSGRHISYARVAYENPEIFQEVVEGRLGTQDAANRVRNNGGSEKVLTSGVPRRHQKSLVSMGIDLRACVNRIKDEGHANSLKALSDEEIAELAEIWESVSLIHTLRGKILEEAKTRSY